ncbi:MAG TPA: DUF3147 family protein [Terriglobales bacterium]|nr:DUF3147 family protein [Terriglobales bacterium]
MTDILVRFVIGGVVVSLFAVLGDLFKPKSFAGLFGAAPSVALATLGLTVAKQGQSYVAIEARSMVLGAAAFFIYASWVSWGLMHYKPPVWLVASLSILLWLATAGCLWWIWLR